MNINILLLDGWDETSTWGIDQGLYYAQLTPNGVSAHAGPQVWITPPRYVIPTVTGLLQAIAAATSVSVDIVDEAMSRGLALSRGEPPTPR